MAEVPPVVQRIDARLRWPRWEEVRPRGPGEGAAVARPAAARDPALLARHGGSYTLPLEPAPGGDATGPLAGLEVAVKDLIAVAGCPLGAGSAVRADAPPEPTDAAIVAALRRLGAEIAGLVALHEFAFGVTGVNPHTGTPRNPAAPDRVPGGSSSGSATAVADGTADVALGTDTGGSVRIPAAFCGVVGFKPAFGSYPTDGVFPLSPTLDHVGVLARSVGAVRRVHAALGHDAGTPRRPARVGVARPDLDRATPTARDRVEEALARLRAAGAEVVDVPWPDGDRVAATTTALMYAEAAAVHRPYLDLRADAYGEDVRRRLELGAAIPGPAYVAAARSRAVLEQEVRVVLAAVDCVVGPTVGFVAPPLDAADDPDLSAAIVANTRLGNAVRCPALSLPLPGGGAPVGLQITAADDPTTLALAEAVEELLAG